jgi:hypothetical protein
MWTLKRPPTSQNLVILSAAKGPALAFAFALIFALASEIGRRFSVDIQIANLFRL